MIKKEHIKKNKGTGAGGAKTNATGLRFEESTYLYEWIKKAGFEISEVKITTKRSGLFSIKKVGKVIGYYGRQGKFYDLLKLLFPKKINNDYIKKVLSKKINPDAFIYSKDKKLLTIFEKKWQQCSGSVDEKIQTAPFKLEMFSKLLEGLNVQIQYQYILSSWFNQEIYRNVREYYAKIEGINTWIEDFDLENLDITQFI